MQEILAGGTPDTECWQCSLACWKNTAQGRLQVSRDARIFQEMF